MLKFNPPREVARYALYVDHGNGKGSFKPFNDLGSTKNSYQHNIGYSRYAAKILENVDGDWYTLFDIPAGTEYKDLPWVKDTRSGGWYSNRTVKRAVPMTREEYAEWRLAVEREKVANN